MFVGDGLRYVDFVFYPVGIFLETEFLHVYRIVGMVVDGCHGAELVESFDQHTFCVEVGKSERSDNVSHAPFLPPIFYGSYQCGGYFRVVDEINPSETDVLGTPFFVSAVVDDSGYTTYYLIVLVGEEVIGFTELERCVFLLVECVKHIVIQVGHGIGVILIHPVIETNKFLKFSLRRDFLDCNSHISYL